MKKEKAGATVMMSYGRGFLRDRKLRRKLMGLMLIVLVLAAYVGTGIIGNWLENSVVRFSIYWLVVLIYTLLLLVLCVYDLLRFKTEIEQEENK